MSGPPLAEEVKILQHWMNSILNMNQSPHFIYVRNLSKKMNLLKGNKIVLQVIGGLMLKDRSLKKKVYDLKWNTPLEQQFPKKNEEEDT